MAIVSRAVANSHELQSQAFCPTSDTEKGTKPHRRHLNLDWKKDKGLSARGVQGHSSGFHLTYDTVRTQYMVI